MGIPSLPSACARCLRRGGRSTSGPYQHAITCCLRVPDTRLAIAHMAAAFFGHPSRQLRLIGVTGTNGKTTSTYLLEAVLHAHGLTPGVIGTVTYRYAGHERTANQTTPAAEDIQRLLREMVDAGVSHCVMEVSSHALAQHRVWSLPVRGSTIYQLDTGPPRLPCRYVCLLCRKGPAIHHLSTRSRGAELR